MKISAGMANEKTRGELVLLIFRFFGRRFGRHGERRFFRHRFQTFFLHQKSSVNPENDCWINQCWSQPKW